MRKVSVGSKLYISILAVFLLFAISFIVFQQTREKQYKRELLNMRLQGYNTRMADAIQYLGKKDEQTLSTYVKTHSIPNLRVTLIDDQGQVIFDNFQKDYSHFKNHANRPEAVSYTHLTLPTTLHECRSRWSPYH